MLYIIGVGLFVAFGVSLKLRSKKRSQYANEPDRWLGLTPQQMIICKNSLLGTIFHYKHDIVSREARIVLLLLSIATTTVVSSISVLISRRSSAPFSLARLQEAAFTVALSQLVQAVGFIPVVRFGLRMDSARSRKAALGVGVGAFCVLIAIAAFLMTVPPVVQRRPINVAPTFIVAALSLAVSWSAVEPALCLVSYFALGRSALRVKAPHGNGGGIRSASAQVAPTDLVDPEAATGTATNAAGASSSTIEEDSDPEVEMPIQRGSSHDSVELVEVPLDDDTPARNMSLLIPLPPLPRRRADSGSPELPRRGSSPSMAVRPPPPLNT